MTDEKGVVMSSSEVQTPQLGRVGYWRGAAVTTPEIAARVESLGFGALWLGGSPPSDLAIVEQMLEATERITVATGIVNIWTAPAAEVAASFHRIEAAHPGRFLLGIGIGHRESIGDRYRKPYSALVDYLDVLDAEGVPAQRRAIAALGPRTLELAAQRSAGTHPYLTTPQHTRFARDTVGPGVIIAPEQRLIVESDPAAARAIGRRFLELYLARRNYRRTLERHGFTAADLDGGATDAAVDALTPWGSPATLAEVVRAQLDAGADHVCVQVLPRDDPQFASLEALASRLALR